LTIGYDALATISNGLSRLAGTLPPSSEVDAWRRDLAAQDEAIAAASDDREKVAAIVRVLGTVSRGLEAKLRPRAVVGAMKQVSRLRASFEERSQRFRKEQVLKKSFEKAFDQAGARIQERLKTHLAGCSEPVLRAEFETTGASREPKELLRLFRERAQAQILDEFAELLWGRSEGGADKGLLRRQVRDAYAEATGRSELLAAVAALLPNSPDERSRFEGIFTELDLALEITTDNLVMRETVDLNEPTDALAQGAAGFPDWARRYQLALTQLLGDKLQKIPRSLQCSLWVFYWKYLLAAEKKVLAFLGSEEIVGLVTFQVQDVKLELDEAYSAWQKLDGALAAAERAVAASG
jgi:hypothetical protein